MTSLTRKQRRQQERQRQKLKKKLNKISNDAIENLENNAIVDTSENLGLPRLSDLISDFAEPLYDTPWSQEGVRDIHDLVCCCWNIGTCSEEHANFLWDILIQDKLDECFDDPDGILEDKLDRIIEQRRSEFAEDRRFIMDFRLEFTDDNCMNLQTASTAMPQEQFLAIQAAKALAMEDGVFEA